MTQAETTATSTPFRGTAAPSPAAARGAASTSSTSSTSSFSSRATPWTDPAVLARLRRRAQSLGPIRPDEAEGYLTRRIRIGQGIGRISNHVAENWDSGRFVLDELVVGDWMRDPAHSGKTVLGYASSVAREQLGIYCSEQTLERRLLLAWGFTREEAVALGAQGVCSTTLSFIAKSDPRLREDLIELAKAEPSDVVIAVGKVGRDRLAAADKKTAVDQARAAMKTTAEKIAKERKQRADERRDNGPRDGGGGEPHGGENDAGEGAGGQSPSESAAGSGASGAGGNDAATGGPDGAGGLGDGDPAPGGLDSSIAWKMSGLAVDGNETAQFLNAEHGKLAARAKEVTQREEKASTWEAGLRLREAQLAERERAAVARQEVAAARAAADLGGGGNGGNPSNPGGAGNPDDLGARVERRLREALDKEAQLLAAGKELEAGRAALAAQQAQLSAQQQHIEQWSARLTEKEQAVSESERKLAGFAEREAEFLRKAREMDEKRLTFEPREGDLVRRESALLDREKDLREKQDAVSKLEADYKQGLSDVLAEQKRLRTLSIELAERGDALARGVESLPLDSEDLTTTLTCIAREADRLSELTLALYEQSQEDLEVKQVKRTLQTWIMVQPLVEGIKPAFETIINRLSAEFPEEMLAMARWAEKERTAMNRERVKEITAAKDRSVNDDDDDEYDDDD